jgi:putative membrane protein
MIRWNRIHFHNNSGGALVTTLLPTISTTFIVISAILVAFGWYYIARRRTETHIRLMTGAAIFASLFFVVYISRTLFVGNTAFGGPESLKPIYLAFLLFHIVLATTGGVLGLITLRLGYVRNLAKHRKIGPVTSIIWFCTAITGVTVYYLLYIKYPGGEMKPVFDAIFS